MSLVRVNHLKSITNHETSIFYHRIYADHIKWYSTRKKSSSQTITVTTEQKSESLLQGIKVVVDNKEVNLETLENWAFIVNDKLVSKEYLKTLNSDAVKQYTINIGSNVPKKYKKLLKKQYDGVVIMETK